MLSGSPSLSRQTSMNKGIHVAKPVIIRGVTPPPKEQKLSPIRIQQLNTKKKDAIEKSMEIRIFYEEFYDKANTKLSLREKYNLELILHRLPSLENLLKLIDQDVITPDDDRIIYQKLKNIHTVLKSIGNQFAIDKKPPSAEERKKTKDDIQTIKSIIVEIYGFYKNLLDDAVKYKEKTKEKELEIKLSEVPQYEKIKSLITEFQPIKSKIELQYIKEKIKDTQEKLNFATETFQQDKNNECKIKEDLLRELGEKIKQLIEDTPKISQYLTEEFENKNNQQAEYDRKRILSPEEYANLEINIIRATHANTTSIELLDYLKMVNCRLAILKFIKNEYSPKIHQKRESDAEIQQKMFL